jgi:hypothetical protein
MNHRSVIIGVAFLVLSASDAGGQARKKEFQWPCASYPGIVRSAPGRPLWLPPQAAESRAIKKVQPTVTRDASAVRPLRVDVLIDAEGKVVCAKYVSGPPMLKRASLVAAMQWEFEPFKLSGVKLAIYAHLELWRSEDEGRTRHGSN